MQFILTSLVSALMMGSGDFFGGLACRRAPVAMVGFIGQAIGLVIVLLSVFTGKHPFAQTAFQIGLCAGTSGSLALFAVYRGLAVGKVAVVAPLSAILGALIPVLVSVAFGHVFGPMKWVGIVAGLVAVYFLSAPGDEDMGERTDTGEHKESGLLYAIVGGIGLAVFYMLLGNNSETHGSLWTLVGERCTVVSIMLVAALSRKQLAMPDSNTMWLIVVAGVCDIIGNLAFLFGAMRGPLPMVALITSLYPAMTMLLGWSVLKQPLTRNLAIGAVCAVLCLVLFALQ